MAAHQQQQQKLGWIGLGNMGRGMAKNIAEKAALPSPLLVHNRTASRCEQFKAALRDPLLADIAGSVGELVKSSDIVFTSLGDDASVEQLYDLIIKDGHPVKGKLFVETSTILSATTEKVGANVTEAGAEFVALPVFGAPAMAENGKLVAVAAGPSASIDRVKPYLDGVMSRATIEMRDEPVGKATLLKISGNAFILSMIETLSEGHVFAEKSGLGSEYLHKFIEMMLPAPYSPYSARMMSGDYMREEPLFAVDLALKDANHAIRLADDVGVDMKITKVVKGHLEGLKDEKGEKGDMPAVYGVVRKEAGLPFSNKE